MSQMLKIGIIGDYLPDLRYHIATEEALSHAAAALSISLTSSWVSTLSLEKNTIANLLKPFHGLWCAPGDYKSMDGAIQAIQFAREQGRPFIGTCGGFQHALIEYARNALGINGAQHEETAPNAPILFISKLACSLVGKRQTIKIMPGSLSHKAYAKEEVSEQFVCNYGLNPHFRDRIQDGRLQITGVDLMDEVRVVEINDHPFFIATLFQPQISSQHSNPHPLITAYLKGALSWKKQNKT